MNELTKYDLMIALILLIIASEIIVLLAHNFFAFVVIGILFTITYVSTIWWD